MSRESSVSRRGLIDVVLVVVSAAAFLLLATYQLDLPGLHYDEAKEAGNNALQLLRGQPVQAFRGSGIGVGSTLLPLMVQDYIGALNVYLGVPVLGLFGVTVSTLRAVPVALGACALLLAYALTRELHGRLAAGIASLLLAVNPSFVFWSRQGIFVTNVTAALALGSALSTLRWWRKRRPRHLYLAAFLCGLGIYAKLLFVWVAASIACIVIVSLVVDHRKRNREQAALVPAERCGAPPAVQGFVAVVLFVVGLVPLLIFNLQTGGTLSSIVGRLGSSYYGVSNAAFWSNLLVRLTQLGTLLRGDHLWYLGGPFGNGAAPWIAFGLLALSLGALLLKRVGHGNSSSQACAVCWTGVLFCLGVAVMSSFTISDLFITHYAMLLPFVFIAVAGLSRYVLQRFGRALALPVLAALLCWGIVDARVTLQYHKALGATGGHSGHSDAIYKLSGYLSSEEIQSPVAMDWGIEAPVVFLTEGRVQPVEVFGYERFDAADAGFEERLGPFLCRESSVYVFHVPEETVFAGRREAFDQLVRDAGLLPVVEAVFYERSGSPLFVVTRLVTS